MDTTAAKHCRYCDKEKPLTEFHRRAKSPDGLSYKCKSCSSKYNKGKYRANPEPHIQRAKEWSEANPDRRREIRHRWKENNQEYARDNLQKFLDEFHSDPERVRTYRRDAARKHRSRYNDIRPLSRLEWARIAASSHFRCVYCGDESEMLEIDHITPVASGGDNDRGNLVPACRDCNRSKSDAPVEDWLYDRFGTDGLARVIYFLENGKMIDSLYQEV